MATNKNAARVDTVFFYGKSDAAKEVTKRLRELGINYHAFSPFLATKRLYRLPDDTEYGIWIHRGENMRSFAKAEKLAQDMDWWLALGVGMMLNPNDEESSDVHRG